MKQLLKKIFPFLFLSFIVMYHTAWHLTLIFEMPDIKITEIRPAFVLLVDIYILIAFLFLAGVYYLFRPVRSLRLRNLLYGAVLAVSFFLAGIRVLDWGTLYFGGKHVDNNFWYHAFYVDGTSFLITKIAVIVISSFMFFYIVFAKMLASYIRSIPSITPGFRGDMRLNVTLFACLVVSVNLPMVFGLSSDAAPAKVQYAEIPEIKVISSFVDYAAFPNRMDKVTLDAGVIEKLKKCGILVKQKDRFPLLKKSIYLDPANRAVNKPRISSKTNFIIVFLESFDQIFLEEERHGYKDLTPNVHEVMEEAYQLTNMHNAAYPTERGMLATLGSTLYLLDRLKGPHAKLKPPIPCKLFLLSDVLKTRGYTNVHVKGGSGVFGSIRSSFINKQSYDEFYAWESVELQMHVKGGRKQGWGLRDDDVFDFAASLMRDNKIREPFMLTINSLDMHPPYDPAHKHPNAKGITLLNAIYNTDRGFGVLWNYFKNSKYRDNTVLIITCDHAMGLGKELKEFFAEIGHKADMYCDIIPCMFLFPGDNPWKGKKNNTPCSNLDITPTILDMMDIDVENPFIGLSVLSDRRKYPHALTSYFTVGYPPVDDRLAPAERAAIRAIGWTRKDQEMFTDYMNKLVLNRMIFPEEKEKDKK